MAAISIKGKVLAARGQAATRTALVGTETIDAHVGAGEIAIVMDSGVALDSLPIEETVRNLVQQFREHEFKTT